MPKIKVNPDLALEAYAAEMLQAKGVTRDDEQRWSALIEELCGQLNEVMDRAIIEAVPEEKYAELDALLDRDASDEEIERFFDNAGVDFEQAAQAALEQYRTDYLNGKIKTDEGA